MEVTKKKTLILKICIITQNLNVTHWYAQIKTKRLFIFTVTKIFFHQNIHPHFDHPTPFREKIIYKDCL